VKRSPLLPIFLIVLVDILGLTVMLPLLPFYAENLGASPTVVGMLLSSYALCQLIAGPILGRMSDHMGRKPLLIVSQIGTLIGFLILASAHTLWVVFVSRIIDGLTAGNLSLAQAYIADVSAEENRAKSFGVIGVAFGIGFMIGPGISGYLSQFGLAWPIFAAAFLSASSVVCTATLLPKAEPHPDDAGARRLGMLDWKGYVEYFVRPKLGALLWQFFLFSLSFTLFFSGFALYAQRRYTFHGQPFGAREVGYVFLYVGFLGTIMQGGLIGRLVKWLGERTMVWSGFAIATVGYGLLAWTHTIAQLLFAATVNAGGGAIRPAVTSLITQQAGKREYGVVLGLTQSIASISQIAAPIVAGILIDHGQLGVWALTTAGIAFLGMLLSLRGDPGRPVV
jgi:MFS family permease